MDSKNVKPGSIEDKFNSAVEEWIEHCQDSKVINDSSARSVVECAAYKKIVSLGYSALPLIRQLYGQESDAEWVNFSLSIVKGHGLVNAVCEILDPEFQIPDDLQGKVRATEEYTKEWLDENMHKYVHTRT